MYRLIFVNSTGWLALYNPKDPNHEAAKELWESLRGLPVRFVLTDYVLDEVYSTLKAFGSLQAAQAFNVVMSTSSLVRLFMTDSVIFSRAWKVFTDDDHPEWTFTDCINYAVIQYLGVSEVITFDPSFTAPELAILPSGGD